MGKVKNNITNWSQYNQAQSKAWLSWYWHISETESALSTKEKWASRAMVKRRTKLAANRRCGVKSRAI